MAGLAFDLAEKQFKDGTAAAPVITYFLKVQSRREQLEKEKLTQENELLKAKVKQIDNAEEVKELYGKALAAMRTYSGQEPDPEAYE